MLIGDVDWSIWYALWLVQSHKVKVKKTIYWGLIKEVKVHNHRNNKCLVNKAQWKLHLFQVFKAKFQGKEINKQALTDNVGEFEMVLDQMEEYFLKVSFIW